MNCVYTLWIWCIILSNIGRNFTLKNFWNICFDPTWIFDWWVITKYCNFLCWRTGLDWSVLMFCMITWQLLVTLAWCSPVQPVHVYTPLSIYWERTAGLRLSFSLVTSQVRHEHSSALPLPSDGYHGRGWSRPRPPWSARTSWTTCTAWSSAGYTCCTRGSWWSSRPTCHTWRPSRSTCPARQARQTCPCAARPSQSCPPRAPSCPCCKKTREARCCCQEETSQAQTRPGRSVILTVKCHSLVSQCFYNDKRRGWHSAL